MRFIPKYILGGFALLSIAFAQEKVEQAFKPSEGLKQIVGLTQNYAVTARLKKVHKLSESLNKGEVKYLWDFLNKKHSDDPLKQRFVNQIKNDVAVVLLKQKTTLDEYGTKMMEMFSAKDKSGTFRHDIVWRDHCIHFLGHWAGDNLDEKEKTKVLDFIYGSIDSNKGTPIPSSALTVINLNKNGLIQKLRLLNEAIKVASKPEYGESARISALQIAAEHSIRFRSNKGEVIKVLKSCIKGECSTCLKVSAISALGTAGFVDNEVETIIANHCRSYDIRLRKAAYETKKKLKL